MPLNCRLGAVSNSFWDNMYAHCWRPCCNCEMQNSNKSPDPLLDYRSKRSVRHGHSNSGPPFFPHLVPPAIMVWIFVWKYIFEPFIHILQHFVLQLSRSTNFCFKVQLPYYLYIHKGMKQSSKYKEGILASTRYFTITRQF